MAAVETVRSKKRPSVMANKQQQVSSLNVVIKLNPKKQSSSSTEDDDQKPNKAAKKRRSVVNGGGRRKDGDKAVARTKKKETNVSSAFSPSPSTEKQSSTPNPSPSEKEDQTVSSLRTRVRHHLYQGLCKVPAEEAMARDLTPVAASVETALLNKWGTFNGKHTLKYRSVLFNIKDDNNPDFRRKVLVGEIKAEAITDMSTEEMASDRRKEEVKHIWLRTLGRENNEEATTDQFQCVQCKKRATKYRLLQIRSADEPMTALVTCVNCGYVWKEE